MRTMILTTTLASLALPLAPAMAAGPHSGWTVRATSLRAGPDFDYPAVRRIGKNRRVDIYGCLDDWSWCDVAYRSDRGWVAGANLVADYQGRRRGISSYLGIGVLTFIFGNYWDNNYRSRPFYNERSRWERHYNDNYKPHWGPRPNAAPILRQQGGQAGPQGRPDAGHKNRVIVPSQPQEPRKITPPPKPGPDRNKPFQGFLQNHGNQGGQGNPQSGQQDRTRGDRGNKGDAPSGQNDKGKGGQWNKDNAQSRQPR